MRRLERAVNLDDLERSAHRRLPRPVYDAVAGGAGDELTLRANRAELARLTLRPRPLVDVSDVDPSTTVLGSRLSLPVLLAPAAYARLVHRDGELALARAAAAAGTAFALATASSFAPEDVARSAGGPRWYQLFPSPDARRTVERVRRARDAGYDVLCVTVDTPVRGRRERDLRNRMTVPLRPTARLALSAASRPAWAWGLIRGASRGSAGARPRPLSVMRAGRLLSTLGTPVTRQALERVRSEWDGPLVVKGVLRGDACGPLLDLGVDGVVVSNHGGRQLDGAPATIRALPEVVEAVGGRAEVLLDGGVRRGVDVVRALSLGARAVLVGRPWLYGLAAGGQAGVERMLELLRAEVTNAMGLVGAATVADVGADLVGPAGPRVGEGGDPTVVAQ